MAKWKPHHAVELHSAISYAFAPLKKMAIVFTIDGFCLRPNAQESELDQDHQDRKQIATASLVPHLRKALLSL